jgi:glycerophosphoryl diester phosphodiesterase
MAEEGLPIVTWTVNRVAVARRLAERGAAVIITDVPDRIMPALRSMRDA